MRINQIVEGNRYKCTCYPGDADPDCPVHGLEPMEVGDALDVKPGVAEGLADAQQKIQDTINKLEDRLKHAKSDEQWDRIRDRIERLQAALKRSKQGVAEGHADQQKKVFKKNGHPVGEVGIDRESSPGVGQWYMKYYATGDDFSGYDSMEEAVADLKHLVSQFKAEGLNEFAAGDGGGGSGNYFQELASAWYNGAFDTGSLQKGIKSKEDVERLLNRGIVAPDGVTRKYAIDYNSDFDGVVISSDDYYEHSDYGDAGDEIDSRTGQPWGPYDYMEFRDKELDEGVAEAARWRDPKYKGRLYTQEPPDYNDTREYDRAMWDPKPQGYPGRKELPGGGEYDRTDPLVKGFGRSGVGEPVSKGPRKGLPSRDQITSLKQSIKDISGRHTRANLPEQGMAEGDKKPEPPEADYGADYQAMVSRVKKLAGLGPLKTVYDPAKRVYKNVPTAVQTKKEQQ